MANKSYHQEMENEFLFTELKFDLSKQETLKVAAKVRTFCQDDLAAFAFISLYLQISLTKKVETQTFE